MAQLPPPVHGAALRNQSLLESELIHSRFDLLPLPLKYIDDMKDMGKFSFKKIGLMIIHACRMIHIFTTRRIHLVYFTMSPSGGAFYRDILFIFIARLFRKKRLLHFRVKGIKNTSRSAIGKSLVRYAFRGSDIVCLSNHHVEDMAGLFYRKPFIVPNGIKVEQAFLYLAHELYSNESTEILFLSNLSRKKGLPELIEALAKVKARNYNFSARLVGSEWDMTYAEVNQLILESGLEDTVRIEGPKYGKEKFEFIARADIFVFPTYFELFPGVVLEAMQFGKAIVSTFEGSIPEMIDNSINGLLVENRNVEQLAQAIASLIDHPEKRQELGKLAREKFFREFTLAAFEQKMCSVYEEAITSDRR